MIKGKIFRLLTPLIALALLGVSCNKSVNNQMVDQPESKEEAMVENQTRDWQVYSHTEPDYMLKYPEDWYAISSINPTMGDLEFLNISTTTEEFTPTDCSFGVKSLDQPITGDVEVAQSRATETDVVEIDGIMADKYVFAPNEQYLSHSHFLNKNGYWYNLELMIKKDIETEPCLDILSKILSSFKFGS